MVERKPPDPRFQSFASDPRYRLPSKKQQHTKLDRRFAGLLKDEEFARKGSKGVKVDRYGRPANVASGKHTKSSKDRLGQLYELGSSGSDSGSSDEEEGDESDLGRPRKDVNAKYDPARGGGFDDSSSSSSSSSSESESDAEEEGSDADVLDEEELREGAERERKEVEGGEVTQRLAVVNMDFDHLRAADVFAVASSFCPVGGRIVRVTIYPSEFGKERMERERMQGPAPEMFSGRNKVVTTGTESSDEDDDEEKVKAKLLKQLNQSNEEAEAGGVDSKAMRRYQMQRLRYFYAVVEFSDKGTAHMVYNEMDGREYLSTANFFDLRFVPDEVSFENDQPREQCEALSPGYKPQEFVTEALTHSKVRLTWDEEDQSRKEVQKRAFSNAAELEENDLQAYLGSDSSDAGSDAGSAAAANSNGVHGSGSNSNSKKDDERRNAMRAALGLPAVSSNDKRSKDGRKQKEREEDGGMQITFSAALSKTDGTKADQNEHSGKQRNGVFEETTKEKYIRKERERKARRKANSKAGRTSDLADDDENDDADASTAGAKEAENGDEADDPFDDPFFEDPEGANAVAKKASKKARRAAATSDATVTNDKEAAARKARERAELDLLLADDFSTRAALQGGAAGATTQGFDMNEIKRAEKLAATRHSKGKKSKHRKKGEDAEEEREEKELTMGINVDDPRFSTALFESHDYAIDPTNPRFSGTNSMKALLEEGRKRRRKQQQHQEDGEEAEHHVEGARAHKLGMNGRIKKRRVE